MKKYCIVAYPECEGNYYLPRKEMIISARDRAEAERIGWRTFAEYHEVGVFEVEENEQVKK